MDAWRKRDQVLLLEAVEKCGQQNWAAVSRYVRTATTTLSDDETFSSKGCASQYSKFLELPDQSRRQRRGESSMNDAELLAEVRQAYVTELQTEITGIEASYRALRRELQAIEQGAYDVSQLQAVIARMTAEESVQAPSTASTTNAAISGTSVGKSGLQTQPSHQSTSSHEQSSANTAITSAESSSKAPSRSQSQLDLPATPETVAGDVNKKSKKKIVRQDTNDSSSSAVEVQSGLKPDDAPTADDAVDDQRKDEAPESKSKKAKTPKSAVASEAKIAASVDDKTSDVKDTPIRKSESQDSVSEAANDKAKEGSERQPKYKPRAKGTPATPSTPQPPHDVVVPATPAANTPVAVESSEDATDGSKSKMTQPVRLSLSQLSDENRIPIVIPDLDAPASPVSWTSEECWTTDEDEDEDEDQRAKTLKSFKANMISAWNDIASYKDANAFRGPVAKEIQGYQDVVYRPMDLNKIKKNVETGVISSTRDFEHQLHQVYANAMMYNSETDYFFNCARDMRKESIQILKTFKTNMKAARKLHGNDTAEARETRRRSGAHLDPSEATPKRKKT